MDWLIINSLPRSAKDIISQMLRLVPEKRVTAQEALQHEWFIVSSSLERDILTNVRNNFQARATFRKAVNVIQGINRMRRSSAMTQQRQQSMSDSFSNSDTLNTDSPLSQSPKDGISMMEDMLVDIELAKSKNRN